MSAQDAEGIRKHVSKLRFSRHARTMYEESVKTRASIDSLTAAIVAATSEAENRAEDASNEHHEHAARMKGLLERILSELLAVRSLPPAAIDGSSGTPVASSPATLGGVGSSSSSSSSSDLAPALSSDTVSHAERVRRKSASLSRRAHWILTGAPPIDFTKSIMQNIFGDTTEVTEEVQTMLTTLTNFDVSCFFTPSSNKLPVPQHTKIMCRAIVSLAAESIPASGGAREDTERKLCRARVRELAEALRDGSDLLLAASMRHSIGEIEMSTAINADMATWTQALRAQAGLLKETVVKHPRSECSVGNLCLPTWPKLKALVYALDKLSRKNESSTSTKHKKAKKKAKAAVKQKPKKGPATPKGSRKYKPPTSRPGAKTANPEPKQKKAKTAAKQDAQHTSTG